jgi:hypothetical protein
MSCRTCCRSFSLICVLLALAVLAVPAFAQNPNLCLQNQYNAFVGQTGSCTSTPSNNSLGCTANDVSVSQIPQSSINVISGGQNNPPTCFSGGNVTFTAAFDILTTANAANAGGRDNVGLYLATLPDCTTVTNPQPGVNCNTAVKFGPGGKVTSTALCGACSDNIIGKAHTLSGVDCVVGTAGCILGSDNYHENDAGVFVDNNHNLPDNCGDTSSTDFSPAPDNFGAGSEGVGIEVQNLFCGGPTCTVNGVTGLQLQYCTSWQTPGSAIACNSTDGSWPYPFDPLTNKPEAVPGTSSKCNCSTVCLPITPVSVTATATKKCTTLITTAASISCNEGPEGLDAATYTITLTPTATAGDTVLDAICDSVYGTIVGSPAGCATQAAGLTNITCAAGATITSGTTYTCQFTAPAIGESTSVTDTVTFYGHSSANPSVTFSQGTNSVTVFSEDAPSTATVTKGFVANKAACVTVRYSVDVSNTGGADETLSLSGLNDTAYGNITQVQGNVLGTTCGVDSGLGTFAGKCTIPSGSTSGTCTSGNVGATCTTDVGCTVAGAGAFPKTLGVAGTATSDYNCNFDAQFCTSAFDGQGCFTHTNAVSATLAVDNSESISSGKCTDSTGATVPCLTENDLPTGGLLVTECLTEH